ncbi:MAG: efflux RND transporter periplasmic adaptor subunit [Pedosphaera sp.]|nr:efflux RND transporter periplasmic adaptor subunit [Pedosphaera sp.]
MKRLFQNGVAASRQSAALVHEHRDGGALPRRRYTDWVAITILAFAQLTFAAEAPKPAEVKVARPTRGEIIRYVTVPGGIRANQQATLYAKVAGYLKSLAVDKGDRVQAGQSLGEIEVPELLADSSKYKAEVKVAETDFQRVSAAQKKSPDLVTPQAVDEAKGRFEIASANLERTQTLLSYAKITAPFSGIVTARFVDPGAFIPSATSGSAAQNAAIVTLADFNTVRAQVALPEVEASLAQVGQPVKLTVEGLAGKTFEAKVSRLSYALDDATKTMLIEADLPNPDLALRPGMYATVKVGVEKHVDALLLPVEALVMEKANAFTFVAESGKAKKTAIKIGFNDGAKVEVLTGLKGNEAVILVGKMTLADGAAVNVTEAK